MSIQKKAGFVTLALLLSGTATAGLAPLSSGEMSKVSGQALGINFNDISIISDKGGPADMTYMTLRPGGEDDYVRLSHFFLVGSGGNRNVPTDGDGVSAGSVNSPVTLQFPNISNTLVNDGSLGNRSAMILCWTGSDCSDPTNIDHSLTADTTQGDMGFRFDIIGNDPNLTPRIDSDNGFTDIVWAELTNFGFEGDSVPFKARRQIYGGNFGATCDDGDGDGVCQDGIGTTLYDNDIVRTDGKRLEPNTVFGGSWLALWPDELTGLSAAGNLRIEADQLRWTYASNVTGGVPTSPNYAQASTVAFNDVKIDLQLGHPFYQPLRLYTTQSYDPGAGVTRAEQVLEISSIPLADGAGRQPGEAGYSGVDCSTGSACDKFYDPATNLSDIYIGQLQFGDADLGASYVQGLQIQYLRVQTHEIAN
ncbi:MAG: hypothetical protein ACQES2_11300 [Pseudomonadota bacterium]